MREECIVCGKKIKRRKGNGNGAHLKSTRNKYAVTCSKNCSRTYRRIFYHVRDKLRRKK